MNKATEIVVSAVAGAFASEVLKLAIGEAKLVFAFGYVSKELASTMEDLLPIVTEVESMQDVGELKTLKDTIDKARVVVEECKSVKKWEIHLKHYYTRRILKRCNGLPLLIEVLGVTLKGKPLYYWKGQVESWSEKETNLDGVLKLLQPSFTTLEPHLKECFMDMGSFLEDQKIRASVIIDIWVELYGKSPTSSSLAYMKYLDDLASQNLLKLIPLGRKEHEDGFYNELLVTQHDVLRELAIHQSKQEAVLERKRHSLVIQGDNYPDDLLLSQRESVRFLSISTGQLFYRDYIFSLYKRSLS
uniref:RPW8 domain-containing protein n=1 Tax=Brassica oleracea TaxID=3712 RepID=A0A3P6E069_BRAOL|nr:unnamed protein product [Brassica oleracea]